MKTAINDEWGADLKLVAVNDILPNEKVFGKSGIYMTSPEEEKREVTKAKAMWQKNMQNNAPIVKDIGNGKYKIVSRWEVVLAAKELGISGLPVNVKTDDEIPLVNEGAEAILSYDHLLISYARIGREVPVLLEYVEREWSTIKKQYPGIKLKKDFVGSCIGYSNDTVDKILVILEKDPDSLADVDNKKLPSLEAAFQKVTRKDAGKKQSTLTKENIWLHCTCALKVDAETGETCPRLQEFIDSLKKGDVHAAA